MSDLFPQLLFTDDEVSYDFEPHRRGHAMPGRGQYVVGHKHELFLEGDFNLDELKALVAWMEKP